MSRVILVSNRLPMVLRAEKNHLVASGSAGGLANGLKNTHEQSPESLWVGWPGDISRLAPPLRAEADALLAERRFVPVAMTRSEIARYYDGFSNSVLWPLFHYLLDRIPAANHGWEAYRTINERFADVVAAQARPGDRIWVHDYQLLLLPALLRRRIPGAKIGFFLHIPFPAAEVFRTLPWREPLLEGMLGSDLVGFHTIAYKNHFAAAVRRLLGVGNSGDAIRVPGREIRLGVFPMGIDAAHFEKLAGDEEVKAEVEHLRTGLGNERMLLGVDRLDYTKGMIRRLMGFERLLEREPQLRGRVRLVQVAVPSRDNVKSYQQYRREVEEAVGRINGTFGTVQWVPIHYVHRPLSERTLVALYRATDVMVVTPLRDGMNLVAKEFVACRTDGDGVLLLSEFAGAAAEMAEAVVVNPYDVGSLADAYQRALSISEDERRFRMRALRARVITNDASRWVQAFLDSLQGVASPEGRTDAMSTPEALEALARELASSPRLVALLDYDGTLVPLAQAPDLAAPDAALGVLLRTLAERRGVEVHIVSGRRRETLERWLGTLPLGLHAEHGFWSRARPDAGSGAAWTPLRETDVPWKLALKGLLEHFTETSPGALVEEKSASIAWHYRMMDPDLAATRVDEVRQAVTAHIRALPLELIEGDKVLEVRIAGVNKGVVLSTIDMSGPGVSVLAIGNDGTDEDLFQALSATVASASTVVVGGHPSTARFRLENHAGVRKLLERIIALR
jgi:trehalose 6-phosphate synthase/phosphatase